MDGKHSHWLSGKFYTRLVVGEKQTSSSSKWIFARKELPRVAAYQINCISRFKCGIVSLVTVFSALNVQHLPQSSSFSPAVLKQWLLKQGLEVGGLSMIRWIMTPLPLFAFFHVACVLSLRIQSPATTVATFNCLFSHSLTYPPPTPKKKEKKMEYNQFEIISLLLLSVQDHGHTYWQICRRRKIKSNLRSFVDQRF